MKLVAVPLVLTPFAVRRWQGVQWGTVRRLLPVGVLVAVAEYFISLAFATLPASIATPLVGLQAVVAALLGGIWLAESHTGVRVVAAVVAVAGIGLISAV
jgi:drug/metabolite transporter (DMT)-like permease